MFCYFFVDRIESSYNEKYVPTYYVYIRNEMKNVLQLIYQQKIKQVKCLI